ncbi:MAG: FAD-binding oxidoreductase, partial [Actinomycetota bacterium]|nr:FAD-binding oxidoreductase [Actinomycetota bacterium]
MSAERNRAEMKWWGWGSPYESYALPERAASLLRSEVGLGQQRRPAVGLEQVRLREPALPGGLRDRLQAAAGADNVRDDRRARILHAAGKGYVDLVRQRSGQCEQAPDAVVAPESHRAVQAVLAACADAGVAVVPFGGGTSVVGGVEPVRGEFPAVIALDLGRLDALVSIDEGSLVAVFEPGLRGPEAEGLLARRGLTLGHFPQSFRYATLGGFAATRSVGQASTGYGRFDELVKGLRCAAPAGDVALATVPASAAGPSMRELIVGSEGTLGVITQLALRVRPRPRFRRYEGWMFASFADGIEALRRLEQQGVAPEAARLSDEEESRVSSALAGDGVKQRAGRLYLRARGFATGCLFIGGWEGGKDTVRLRHAHGARLLRRAGGLPVGRGPGAAWERSRFAAPHLRDELLERGVMVDTLETATTWSNLLALHAAVVDALHRALARRGTPPLIMCHVSHLYPTGASLYFTF